MNQYTQPNWHKSALITIDTQHDTLDGQPFAVSGTSAALPQMKQLLDVYRQHQWPIVHMVRIYLADGSNADLCRKAELEEGFDVLVKSSPGAELARKLFGDDNVRLDFDRLLAGRVQSVTTNEVIMYKPRWGAFYQTPLQHYLQEIEVDTLVFCGCNFPNCPRASIYEASERDYKIAVARDAISGIYEQGVVELERIGVWVATAKDIIQKVADGYSE